VNSWFPPLVALLSVLVTVAAWVKSATTLRPRRYTYNMSGKGISVNVTAKSPQVAKEIAVEAIHHAEQERG
jgi:hypothetical protein